MYPRSRMRVFGRREGKMTFARKSLTFAAAALLTLTLIFACGAWAEEDPVDFTIQVTPQSLTAPGTVSVSLRVSNPTDQDMQTPVTLYDPAGNVVPSFGDGGSYILKSGDSRPWEGEWNVTEEQLNAGEITYTLKYMLPGADGQAAEFTRQATARIEYAGEHVALTVNRTISPEVVRNGGTATVTYELYNSGNVELKDIRVKEKISKTAQKVASLPAGKRQSLTFTSRIGNADLTSSADITYQAVGSTKTLTQKVDETVIPLATPNLKMELSSPTAGVNIGEAATLEITFTNAGNVSYSNVTVAEAKKGEILTNLSIPAGATVKETVEFILNEPTTFKVTATLPDNTGETKTMTKELSLGVFDPEKTMLLTLNLTADQDTISQAPADVRFHLTVTNNSNVKADKIAISHGETAIYTIASMEPGASVTLDRDVRVSQAGKFRFTATVKDSLNNLVSFDSNTVQITYAQPTSAPTQVPVVTVAPPELVTAAPVDQAVTQGRDIARTAAVALGILLGAGLVLFAVSSVIRLKNRSKSNAAYDHLDLAERRDYTEPADEEEDDLDESGEADDDYDDRDGPEDLLPLRKDAEDEMPHEKLIRDAKAAEEAAEDVAEDAVDELAGGEIEGGYRVTRSEETENTAPAEEAAEDAEAEAPRRRHRRAKRAEDEDA